jgi:outer membrane protein TolC
MKKIFFPGAILSFALAFTPAAVSAQSQPDALQLDLALALEIALSDNPTIKTSQMEVDRFDYVRKEAMSGHLPTLIVGGQASYNIIKQEMAKGMSFGSDMTVSATADLTVPLFVPAIYSTMRLGRVQQELAVEQARASRLELSNAVKKAFFQVLLLEKSYAVLEDSAMTISQTVENTRTMFEAGLASEFDLLSAEVQLSNLQPQIISVGNAIGIAKQMLRMYLCIPEHVEIELTDSLDEHRDAAFDVVPAFDIDLADNSDIRQLNVQQELMRQQVRLANTGYAPSVLAFGSLMLSGADKTTSFGFTGVESINKWWWQTPFSAGIRVSIPIFTGLKEHYKTRQLKNSIRQIDLQKDYLMEAKLLEGRTATNGLITARETMMASEMTVSLAEKAYNISKTRFESGSGTMLEVNQAELQVTQARLNQSQAIYDFLAAQADYAKVLGQE